ncbi:MAG: hypothetical protein KAS04_03750 [Candidatus Aenigmarchaeota archaeon]|nr:hypothetical protein [Candidatus Aenigmarchaeota archaeon]
MNCIESVFDISEKFMEDPSYVYINYDKINEVVSLISQSNFKKFEPAPIDLTEDEIEKECYLQLLGGSINYCYWVGKHNIRPNDCDSGKMFDVITKTTEEHDMYSDEFMYALQWKFAKERFPLLEERLKHIDEVFNYGRDFIDVLINNTDTDVASLMEYLIRMLPGYASDMFLKRASLFFLMMYRKFGWFEKDLHSLHIPADYQVPKMFHFFGCFTYHPELYKKIDKSELIAKGSLMECEIRAATIIVAKKLCEITGWNVSDVDAWFWLRRRKCDRPFHLTVTTDY